MYPLIDWPVETPVCLDESQKDLLLLASTTDEYPEYTELRKIIETSDGFEIKFPIDTGRCKMLKDQVPQEILLRNVNSVYPVLHERVIPLFVNFILHKRAFGSNVEKKLYENMNFLDLVDRLLKKRAVGFGGHSDYYLLRNKTKGFGGWEEIGKDTEESPLVLEDCLSCDEIKLSALLSVSSYTYFINNGSRRNRGVISEDRENLQDEGIIIGLIGTRLVRAHCMEYEEIVIAKSQNDEKFGYGKDAHTTPKLFSDFYEKPCWIYDDFLKSQKWSFLFPFYHEFTKISDGAYFDNVTFAKRLAFSIDTLFFEANSRAREKGTSAYVHIVGIGLGVWMISSHQTAVFMETFAKRITYLGDYLHNISDLHFAYINSASCGKYKHGSTIPIEGHPNKGIRIFISEREPHEKLVGDNEGKLLVVSYAWDGNALPGNEFWSGSLGSSSDPAAACSTQIAEIHNPHINRHVSARNLRIASRGNVIPFEEYVQTILTRN